jgi:chitinase
MSDLAGATDGGAVAGATSGQWVMGYYVGYDIDAYPIAQIDWTGLTHIAFSPMTVKADGSLDTSFDDSNGSGPQDAVALSTAAHAHGVRALLMLGGANDGANIAAAATAARRADFVTALLNEMDAAGYDGIDLDWEDSVNLDDLIALAQALRAARPKMLLTYPGPMVNPNFQTVDSRMATLALSLDRFNVQSYYPDTALTGQGWSSWFVSPLSGSSGSTPIAIDDTLANGTTQQITGGDNDYPLSLFYAEGGTFDTSTAAEQHRDATASEPYLSLTAAITDQGCGAATRYISYDDETSIIAKGTFSKNSGYGGIIVWTLEEGYLPANASGGRARNSLMQALKTGFIDP